MVMNQTNMQQNTAGPSSATMHTRQGSSPLPRHQNIGSSSIHNQSASLTTNTGIRPTTPNRSQPMMPNKTESSISSRSTSSAFSHCSFCLLAEFDIDKGSTLSHQYPAPSGYDEHMLAELMLPDGVHARSEDWTVFFLPIEQSEVNGVGINKSSNNKGSLSSTTGQNVQSRKGKDRENLYCVLNLVRTKHDNSVRRGALVKAIAIVTRHPFIHIFKPALLLALDDYFRQPGIDVLMKLFDALNSLDLARMPQLTLNEKKILKFSDRRDLFDERFPTNARSIASLRPLGTTTGTNQTSAGSNIANNVDESEKSKNDTYESSTTSRLRSRSGSESSAFSNEDRHTYKSVAQHNIPSERRTVPHKPSLASLRLGSGGSNILRRKPSASAPAQESPSNGSNLRSQGTTIGHDANSLGASNMSKAHMLGKVKDTHVWETSVSYGKIQELPIRVPTDVFDEEVGEYSLIHLINTFGSSHPIGPQHGHLHSNGHLTHPIILLFNAVVTGKRVIFLGHNLPAHQVAGHVLSLCALASGCGASWRGIVSRCFPYANLGMIDELEKVPGYIAGVTNPRFEDLRAWDVLCNVENGKITIHKSIEPAPAVRPNAQPSETITSTSFSSGIGPDGEARMIRAPSEPEIYSGSVSHSHNGGTSKSNSRERSGSSTTFEARHDAADNLFMDEIVLAISARYGERYVRSRFMDYAANFIRTTARHEEYYYGSTSLAPSSQPFLNGQLGSGAVYPDREAELKDIQINSTRVDGWRNTEAYSNLVFDITNQEKCGNSQPFDLGHQIARLRRAKKMGTGESELIFTKIAKNVRTQEEIVGLLALLPAHHGGLSPISNGLFHSSPTVQASAHEVLIRIASHSVGRKMMQGLNLFHRLAFARYLSDGHEATANSSSSYFRPSNAFERSDQIATVGQRAMTPNSFNQRGPSSYNTMRMNGNTINSVQMNEQITIESSLSPPPIDNGPLHSPIESRNRHAPSSSIGMQNSSYLGGQDNHI